MIIDWNQLELNSNNSKEISFERFCFHFASIMFYGYGEWIYPYNAAGSEFYLELRKPIEYAGKKYKQGDVIGWQAKFWVNHNDLENSSLNKARQNELKEGLENTLKRNGKLVLWIVCTPGQFVEDSFNNLKNELTKVSEIVNIAHWHKAIFESTLTGKDSNKYQGVFAYYFCKKTIDKLFIDRLTQTTIESLKQKFDVELHSASTFESHLMGIIDKECAKETLYEKLYNLKDRIERYKQRWLDKKGNNRERNSGQLSDAVFKALREYEDCVLDIGKYLISLLHDMDVDVAAGKGLSYVDSKKQSFKDCASRLAELTKKISNHTNEAYILDFYVEDIVFIKYLIFGNDKQRDESIVYTMKLRKAHYFPVFAQAGYGKTHFACSLASAQLSDNMPVLLITGSRFRKCIRPQDVFLNIFDLNGSMTFDELIKSLDLLASFYKGARMPIIIDGLNESFPNESVWKDELPLIIKSIENTEHLILITTCREKSEYIQKIYGKYGFEMVDNASLLTGIEDFNLQETIHKYFRKYNITKTNLIAKKTFRNPLLLKIFCEVNKGSRGLTINDYSLTESMKMYSERLVNQLSTTDGAVNRVLKHKVGEGLKQMGKLLWKRETRTVDYFDDFYKIFEERAETLLEEGLCFQIDNVTRDSGEVKFTYDLLAGYHIAFYLVSQVQTAAGFTQFLNNQDNYNRLFGKPETQHPLAEDIMRSLIFVVREKYQQSLIELLPDDNSFAKLLNGLDVICASEAERDALHGRLSLELTKEIKMTICAHVKNKISEYNSVTGISVLLPAFKHMTSEEFDALFHCQFITYRTLYESVNCVKKYLADSLFKKDALVCAVLMTGCYSNEYRQELIRLIIDYAKSDFSYFYTVAKEFLTLNDPYIREAIYIVLHGAVVGCDDKVALSEAIDLLSDDLKTKPTSHIIMLDCCDSLFDYAEKVCKICVDKSVLKIAKAATWVNEYQNDIWVSGVYAYDFEKYHLRPYSTLSYNSKSEYTSDDLQGMILWRMKHCGYKDDVYAKLTNDYSDNRKYFQEYVEQIPFKHVKTAQRELVGWLLLNNKVEPEYKGTFRTAEIEIDPSYPYLKPKKQLISVSYLPQNKANKTRWLNENPLPIIKGCLCGDLLGNQGEWVLLYGHLNQISEEKEARLYWCVKSGLTYKASQHRTIDLLAKSHSHMLASEIGWREMELNSNDYYEPSLGVSLLQEYKFSGWDSIRPSIPNFYFLADHIQKDYNLEFRVKELRYYKEGNPVTELFQDSSSMFLYIKKDFMNEITKRYKVNFIQEIYSEKIDTHREKGIYGWAGWKEYKDRVVM